MSAPLCKDCRHIQLYDSGRGDPDTNIRLATCERAPIVRNMVSGDERHLFCETERSSGQCGPAGKNFEQAVQSTTP